MLEITDQLHAKGVTLQIQNLGIDTATPTGQLMLTMIGAIATFEREIMLERQAEGIARQLAVACRVSIGSFGWNILIEST
ncbi:recombinase family protein [Aeromonas veronii]